MTPVRKNEVYTMDITGMTHEGQGVGRIDNFTVFVDGALEGETYLSTHCQQYRLKLDNKIYQCITN